MSIFEFAFTLFGLILGLALTAVLTGFVNVLKAKSASPGERTAIRIGWLTPLLAGIVVFDLLTFWLAAWDSRDLVALSLPVLLFGAGLTSLYFVTASLIFPDDPSRWPNLDDWFDRHKGQVGAGIALANVGFSFVNISSISSGTESWANVPVFQYAYILLMLSLTVTRRRWQSLTVLIVLTASMIWGLAGLPVI